jgi:hypothetical protein
MCFSNLGLKVFMDARSTVTAKEGDRYPLRPPKYLVYLTGVALAYATHSELSSPQTPAWVEGSTPGFSWRHL